MDELTLEKNTPLRIDGLALVATDFEKGPDGTSRRATLTVAKGGEEQEIALATGALVTLLGGQWEVTAIDVKYGSSDLDVAETLTPEGSVTLVKRDG